MGVFKRLFGGDTGKKCAPKAILDTEYEAEAIRDELKENLERRWETAEKSYGEEYDEKFNRLVDEAVLVIKEKWNVTVSYGIQYRLRTSDVELNAYNAFSITDELFVLSDSLFCIVNPATGRECFSDNFKLSSVEEKERFVAKVMSKLPLETTYKMEDGYKCVIYSFYIHIPME